MNINELVGKTLLEVTGIEKESTEIRFYTTCGKIYLMYHEQDCCECVDLEDFEGDPEDLRDAIVISAEEREVELSQSDFPENQYFESATATFYDIQTTKGSMWLRWLGESNGYYSESVSFKLKEQL